MATAHKEGFCKEQTLYYAESLCSKTQSNFERQERKFGSIKENNITVLKLFSTEEYLKNELTSFQKQLDNLKASADVGASDEVSVESDYNTGEVKTKNNDIKKLRDLS